MKHLIELQQAVERIMGILKPDYGLAKRALDLPDNRVREFRRVEVVARSTYDQPPVEVFEAARAALNAAEENVRSCAVEERNRLLVEYATEIEGLRVLLPKLAALAAIDAGVEARALAEEASR